MRTSMDSQSVTTNQGQAANMKYITSNKGGRKLAFENNVSIEQKVLSNGTVWGDIMGGFCPGVFCLGDFVRGGFRGDFVLEPLTSNS